MQYSPLQPLLVWYVSYGSNLWRERFLCYIQGGRALGSLRANPGCHDTTLPRASRLVNLPFSLYFAGNSQTWNGGVAFIKHTASMHTTKARAYLITLDQLEEVVAQESHCPRMHINLAELTKDRHYTLGTGMYDKLLLCGTLEDIPLITFTGPKEHAAYARPTISYLRSIAEGLKDAYDMSVHEIAQYLGETLGIGHTTAEIRSALSQPLRTATPKRPLLGR